MNKIILSLTFSLILPLFLFGQQTVWEESIHVHLSKNIALTGEPVWMAIHVKSSEKTFLPSIAYVEVINRYGQSVLQLLVPLKEGQGNANLKLPTNINSDNYLLRSYTRSSAYTGKDGIYNQLITIINPEKPAPRTGELVDLKIFTNQESNTGTLTDKKSVSKRDQLALNIPQNGVVSVSLANPFLKESFQGKLKNNIYQALEANNIIPEPYGHVVHAKVKNANRNQSYYLSAHGKQNYFNITAPKSDGNMYFEFAAFQEFNYLLAQKENEGSAMDFELISPFLPLEFIEGFEIPELKLQEEDKTFLTNLILAGQVEEYYYKPKLLERELVNTEISPDNTYLLDDYNRFEDIETTLKEYVPEVYVRKSNKNTLFKVMNSQTGVVFQQNPLLLIDNMPILDPDTFAAFDPKGIEKIDLISRTFYYNNQVFEGVISLSSKLGDFGGFELPKGALYLDYYKFTPNHILKDLHINPNRKEKRFPDFRNLLYWNDQAESGKDLIFPSELSGIYSIKYSFYDGKNWNTQVNKVEIVD
jgi:hypothetical protein